MTVSDPGIFGDSSLAWLVEGAHQYLSASFREAGNFSIFQGG
jgi:hypothetical protein